MERLYYQRSLLHSYYLRTLSPLEEDIRHNDQCFCSSIKFISHIGQRTGIQETLHWIGVGVGHGKIKRIIFYPDGGNKLHSLTPSLDPFTSPSSILFQIPIVGQFSRGYRHILAARTTLRKSQ